jgi:hypothetical protein
MLHFTLTWVLRFAGMQFLGGLALVTLSVYMIQAEKALDPNAPFVPAMFAFGPLPWFGALCIGAAMVLLAWRRGQQAKTASA